MFRRNTILLVSAAVLIAFQIVALTAQQSFKATESRHRLAHVQSRSGRHALFAAEANQCKQRRQTETGLEHALSGGPQWRGGGRARRFDRSHADCHQRRHVCAGGESSPRAGCCHRKRNLEVRSDGGPGRRAFEARRHVLAGRSRIFRRVFL